MIQSTLEILLLLAVLYSIFWSGGKRAFPAFVQLLVFNTSVDLLLFADRTANHLHWVGAVRGYEFYFYVYWIAFIVSTILMLRVLHEVFQHVVNAISGIRGLGRPIYFWACAISVIVAFAAGMTPHSVGVSILPVAAQVLMRSQSVLALCMLAFLTFASSTLGVAYGSRLFGVTFGFGMMATGNLVAMALASHLQFLGSTANYLFESVNLAAMVLWAVYFLKPEPERKLVTVPTTSPLMVWNEIAKLLGHSAGQVAVSYPSSFVPSMAKTSARTHVRPPTPRGGRLYLVR